MAEEWKPLSVRRGKREPSPLHEGVPSHLRQPLRHWLEGVFGMRNRRYGVSVPFVMNVAAAIEVPMKVRVHDFDHVYDLFAGCQDQDRFLDMLDAVLHLGGGAAGVEDVEQILRTGNSAWTINPEGTGLVRRLDASTERAIFDAMAPADVASQELAEAWDRVYGRQPDTSDAWDHAIKAVEALAIPIVCPRQAKPTLGHVLGALDGQGDRWRLALPDEAGDPRAVQVLVEMLRLIWPNPDRHGSEAGGRVPDTAEAQAVFHLATTLVHWLRLGALQQA